MLLEGVFVLSPSRAPSQKGRRISGNPWKEDVVVGDALLCLSDWELADWERDLIVPTSIGPTSTKAGLA